LSPDQITLEIEAGMLVRIGADLPNGIRTIGMSTRSGWRPTRARRLLVGFVEQACRNENSGNSITVSGIGLAAGLDWAPGPPGARRSGRAVASFPEDLNPNLGYGWNEAIWRSGYIVLEPA